jgi:hypothetical protein
MVLRGAARRGAGRSGQRAGSDREHSRQGDRRAGSAHARRDGHHHQSGARRGLDVRYHRRRRRQPVPIPRTRHLRREDRASGIPDHRPRKHPGARRTDDARRAVDEGRQRRRDDNRHRRVADRGHDERECGRQPERAAPSGDAWRSRYLGTARGEGPRTRDEPPGCRRHVGRTAGQLQRARHGEPAELAIPQRRERRRSAGDRRRRLLLRLRRVRRHPGLDRGARHLRPDIGCLPEHGHENRQRQVGRPDHLYVDRRLSAGAQRHRPICRSTASGRTGTRPTSCPIST